MNIKPTFLAAACTMLSFNPSLAQTASPRPDSGQVTGTAAHSVKSLIGALAGTWSAEEIYEPSEMVAKIGKGRSVESYRVGPGGSSLIEEYHGDGVAGKSWGIGTIWWDAKGPGFRFVWCDSSAIDAGCRVSSELGSWNGQTFVMNDKHEVEGKMVFEKEVWSDMTTHSFKQSLYVGNSAENLKLFMTIKAKRRARSHP